MAVAAKAARSANSTFPLEQCGPHSVHSAIPRRLVNGGAWLVIAIGAIVLATWYLQLDSLTRFWPSWPRMASLTAVCFILSGVALLLIARATSPGRAPRRAAVLLAVADGCAALVLIAGLLRLLEHILGVEWGWAGFLPIDPPGTPVPSPMAAGTAFNFLVAGIALFFGRRRRLGALSHYGGLTVLLVAWLALNQYVFGGSSLIPVVKLAFLTVVAFLALGVAIVAMRPDRGFAALLLSETPAGLMVRQLAPAILVVPLFIGWLRIIGGRSGWLSDGDGAMMVAVTNTFTFGVLLWLSAIQVRRTVEQRRAADMRVREQLGRLNLLNAITRAVGERQDLASIYNVVIVTLESELPLDFCMICQFDASASTLCVESVGARSATLAADLSIVEKTVVPIDENGLSRCVHGVLVYEPDIAKSRFPFPARLASGGLRSLVFTPLQAENRVFGVLIAARKQPNSFVSGECEFLKQLSEHVGLAAHQARLHDSLKVAYDELRETQQNAMQQERLRALGQMASGIAHDINNAMSPVSLYAETLLVSEPSLTEEGRGYLKIIGDAIDDVAKTVSNLREFYRQHDPQMELTPVDLNRIVQQVVDLTRARWHDIPMQQGIVFKMQMDLAADLPRIGGVENEIREGLTNLIFNAIDAMPTGGLIRVCTRVDLQPSYSPGLPSPRIAVLEVIDTGLGMSEETRRRCLEPFFTTKGERGTGLGLAMVFGMVKRHSADIHIESTPGAGTTVRVSFVIPEIAPEPATAAATQKRFSTGHMRILVVDDDPLVTKALRDTLAADGHTVMTAPGGQAGIDAFELSVRIREPYSVVITDLGMPYVDGRKVAAAIKGMSASTPVILLTGWGQRLVAEGDIPPHVDAVLSKPPKLHELRKVIDELVKANRTPVH